MDERKILFQGEMQLCRWSESSTNGAMVTMWVHPEDLEAFKLMKARSGKTAGQRIGVVMVAIGDDEAVVEHPPAPAPVAAPVPTPALQPRTTYTPNIGALGMLAVRWCKDRDFWCWLEESETSGMQYSEAAAKEFILTTAGVIAKYGEQASRKHLDTDPECAARFNECIRIPFRQWLAKQGIAK